LDADLLPRVAEALYRKKSHLTVEFEYHRATSNGMEVDMSKNSLSDKTSRLFAETKRILLEHGISHKGMQEIQMLLSRFAGDAEMKEHPSFAELERSGAALKVIDSLGDDDLTLVAGRFPAGHATPIHDHTTWGVACVVRGRDRYIHWERLDAGDLPEAARLQKQFERVLERGDCVYWFDPPGDIHSQQGEGETALELVLFGKNPQVAARHTYDPETGEIKQLKSL